MTDEAPHLPRLYGPVPGAPATQTRTYHFPPATPKPDAAECDDARLVEIATEAIRNGQSLLTLMNSRGHVRAICHLLVEIAEAAGKRAPDPCANYVARRPPAPEAPLVIVLSDEVPEASTSWDEDDDPTVVVDVDDIGSEVDFG